MLIGVGGLGETILELLVREDSLREIAVCDVNRSRGRAKCNLARLSAIAQGVSSAISFLPLDLNRPEEISRVIEQERPDIILNAASLQPWWLAELLPPEPAAVIKKARFGVWLPINLSLPMKLMRTLRELRYPGITVTAPFPDVVNCVLGRIGLASTCGLGNLDEIVPKVRWLAAQSLCSSVEHIRVWLVAHHALEPYVYGKPADEIPPYFLRVEHRGRDVTSEIDANKLLFVPYEIPPGTAIHYLTAGTSVRLIRALGSEEEMFIHVPSPGGLPGGYPVMASRKGVRPAPIPGLSLREAIAINERSHRFDGIERIEEDGTVVFCEDDAAILKSALAYDCRRLQPDEAEDRAGELLARFREFGRRHGVDLEAYS